MVYKKNFIFLYLTLFFVIVFLIFIYVIFILNVKFPLTDLLFAEKDLEVVSKVIYIEGNETYYSFKGSKKNIIEHDTGIKSDLIIETGKDSYVGFFIKDQGYYYLYPETSIYIKKIERYITEKSVKETVINLEKGKLYMDVNFYSINSYFVLETQDCYCELNDARAYFDKTKDFETKVMCFGGKLNYRAYSEKFNFFVEKKNLLITNSIERLINTSNVLNRGYYAVIGVIYQNRLDSILSRLYESENTNLISKEYISSFLSIPSYQYDNDSGGKSGLPEFDIIKFNAGGKGHLEIKTPEDSTIEFNERILEKNRRYIFFTDTGKYSINQDLKFTRVINNFEINENEKKKLDIADIYGITSVFVDNVKSSFEIIPYAFLNDRNINNAILLKISNRNEGTRSIIINSDIYIKELFILNDKSAAPENSEMTGNSFVINSHVMKTYRINGGGKNIFEIVFEEQVNESDIFFIAVFDDIYIIDL